ncbi:hypothetical protein IQ264_08525 [Phormidium sp. LEGE 05292]|uniref:hypothetical protein n=1 Tax=[Phormidium] sp. LEGE 05292 TaxID=767427 RepID=UPI001881342E|nr:hypothetical protein [Phormidium sp. LEGE 05292]MBE9225467.1 hypothetical protein [Phormidium sp. LEGE 05292]
MLDKLLLFKAFLDSEDAVLHERGTKKAEVSFNYFCSQTMHEQEWFIHGYLILTVTIERRMTNAQEQNQQLRQFRRYLFISIFGTESFSPSSK